MIDIDRCKKLLRGETSKIQGVGLVPLTRTNVPIYISKIEVALKLCSHLLNRLKV